MNWRGFLESIKRDPIRIYFPCIGRFLLPDELVRKWNRDTVPLKWKIFYSVENIVLYFLVGLLGRLVAGIMLSLIIISLVFIVMTPVEYFILQKKPRFFIFHSKNPKIPSKQEFFWVIYHAFCFSILGIILGGLI